jgi:hypothetical protein
VKILVWVCFFLVFAGVFPALADGPVPPKRPQTGVAPRAPSISDAELERLIRQRIARSKIAADGFHVRVQGGTATLEGKTDVIQHKAVATRLAKAAGAVRVVNHIRPSDAARAKAASNLSAGRRRAQLKRGEVRSAR